MEQMALDGWFLRQDIDRASPVNWKQNEEALAFGDRIMRIAARWG